MKLNGINFWSNGIDHSAFLDADDKIIEEFSVAFKNTNWHPTILAAFTKYNYDSKIERVLTNRTLNDAIMSLNMRRKQCDIPIKCDEQELDNWIQQRIKEYFKNI